MCFLGQLTRARTLLCQTMAKSQQNITLFSIFCHFAIWILLLTLKWNDAYSLSLLQPAPLSPTACPCYDQPRFLLLPIPVTTSPALSYILFVAFCMIIRKCAISPYVALIRFEVNMDQLGKKQCHIPMFIVTLLKTIYFEAGSMTGILEHLKWETLNKRRRDSRLILLYKGLKGKASIPTDDLIPLVRRCRNDHSMAYQVPIANTDIYKCSSPPPPLAPPPDPQTIRDWNALPDSLISSAEGAEDGIAKFTSLVRARD